MADNDDICAFIGARIREERKARGFSLEELASIVGMNTSFLSYIERNKRAPSLRMVQKVALALRVPIDHLFRGAPAPRPTVEFAGRITAMVKDVGPRRRAMALRVLKTILREK